MYLVGHDELCDTADGEIFGRAMRLSNHVLHALIPPQSSASHTLTTADITHRTLVRLQLYHTNALQRQILGT